MQVTRHTINSTVGQGGARLTRQYRQTQVVEVSPVATRTLSLTYFPTFALLTCTYSSYSTYRRMHFKQMHNNT